MATIRDDGDRITISLLDMRILIALAAGQASGYDIARLCKDDSSAIANLSSGAIRPALTGLLKLYLIAEVEAGVALNPGKPRRVYEITRLGRQVLAWELEVLTWLISLAKERGVDIVANKKDPDDPEVF